MAAGPHSLRGDTGEGSWLCSDAAGRPAGVAMPCPAPCRRQSGDAARLFLPCPRRPGRQRFARRWPAPCQRRCPPAVGHEPRAPPPPAWPRPAPSRLCCRKPSHLQPPGPEGHRARMRRKLLAAGPDALLDHELLEMVLFLAIPRQDTKPLAKALDRSLRLLRCRHLRPGGGSAPRRGGGRGGDRRAEDGAGRRPAPDAGGGAGPAGAEQLAAADGLSRGHPLARADRTVPCAVPGCQEPADRRRGAGPRHRQPHPVYPREVAKRCLELQATAIILVHNHPSGDPTPSRADIEMTAEIHAAVGVLGVVVHDHLVVGNGRHFSFRREGLL